MADSTLFSGYWSFNRVIAGLFIRGVPAMNGYKSLRIRAGISEKQGNLNADVVFIVNNHRHVH